MGKVYFPRICVPVAGIITRQIQFLIQFFRISMRLVLLSERSGILADEQPDAFYPWSFSGITFAGFWMRTDFDFHHSKIQGFQCPCVICNTDLDVFVSCRISGIPGTGKASDAVFV